MRNSYRRSLSFGICFAYASRNMNASQTSKLSLLATIKSQQSKLSSTCQRLYKTCYEVGARLFPLWTCHAKRIAYSRQSVRGQMYVIERCASGHQNIISCVQTQLESLDGEYQATRDHISRFAEARSISAGFCEAMTMFNLFSEQRR